MNFFYNKLIGMLVLSVMLIFTSTSAWALSPAQSATTVHDSSEEGMRAVDLDQPFTVPINEWVQLRDSPDHFAMQIAYLESDSRCPLDVDCVVRGQAIFMVLFSLNGTVGDDLMPIGEYTSDQQNQASFAGYSVELIAVEPPAPKHTETLDLAEYQVTFVIRADGAQATPATTPTTEQEPTPLATPISSNKDELNVGIDQPFDLRVGQTANLAEVDLSVTLRSASENSGCLSNDDCSSMIFEGAMVIRKGEETDLTSMMVVAGPDGFVAYEVEQLQVQVLAMQRLSDGTLVVTFNVANIVQEFDDNRPVAQRDESCPHFSRFDGAAILQADVEVESVTNLLITADPDEIDDQQGICGYISQSKHSADDKTTARYIYTAVDAAHAVIAAKLDNQSIAELQPLLSLLAFGSDVPMKLQVQLAAGLYDQIIPDLLEAASQQQSIRSQAITAFGDEGVWLWQAVEGGYVSALIIRDGDTFALVAALLSESSQEATVRDYSLLIARRMLEPSAVTTNPSPNEHPPVRCDLINADEAAAILGEAVHEQVINTPDEGCGYVAESEPLPSNDRFTILNSDSGVTVIRLTDKQKETLIPDLARTLSEGIEGENENAQLIFNAAILTGDYDQALLMLANIADGSKVWRVEELQGVDKTAVFLWGRLGGRRLAVLLTVDEDNKVVTIVANLPSNRRRSEVREAMVAVMAE